MDYLGSCTFSSPNHIYSSIDIMTTMNPYKKFIKLCPLVEVKTHEESRCRKLDNNHVKIHYLNHFKFNIM